MKRILLSILSLVTLTFNVGCLYAIRYDGPYHGKVVDQETRQPIEDVVVLGTWSVYHFNIAGGNHTDHDARETVTNKQGEFIIPGEGLRVLSSLEPMHVVIFKSGYKYESLPWDSLKIADIKDSIKWEGDVPIFPLRKFKTLAKIKRDLPPYPPGRAVRENKVNRFMEEVEKERRAQGFDVASTTVADSRRTNVKASRPQGFTGLGHFSNENTKDRQSLMQLTLWQEGTQMFGLFSFSDNINGDTKMGLLEKISFNAVTDYIVFSVKLSMGLHSCKIHNNVPSRDLYLFTGFMFNGTISGTLKHADGFHQDQVPMQENIVFKKTEAIIGQYHSREEWEAAMEGIIGFQGARW